MRTFILLILTIASVFIFIACKNNSSDTQNSPFANAQVGDTLSIAELDWLVLDIQDDKALVISENILSQRQWHYEQRLLTWEPSEIRRYLNETFYENTFSEEEKSFIVETTVVNDANPWFPSAGIGVDTMDKVFLLNLEEIVKYFGDSGMLAEYTGKPVSAIPLIFIYDQYNDNRRAVPLDEDTVSWWWLRTPGRAFNPQYDSSATAINGIGEIVPYGIYLVAEGGVRPAMWINLTYP